MTIDVLPKWAYTNHPVKLTYDRKEDPNVSLSVVRSKEIEAINEYLASITAGLSAANARIKELEAQLAAAQPVQTTDYAPVYSWDEPDPAYGKRIGAISNGRLYIETADDTVSIGLPQGMALMKVREP